MAKSIVDLLKKQGKDSSYSARAKLAESYGINNYKGTAAQNIALYDYVNSGKKGASKAKAKTPAAVSSGKKDKSATEGKAAKTGNSKPSYKSVPVDYEGIVGKYMKNTEKAPTYQSGYQQQIDGLLDSILNREKFDYNMNADPLYQQYKDQYTMNGNLAMRDTMGQAAALTGGYGSSYAAAAASQANDAYMSQLNDKSMDLYQLALQKYDNETQGLLNQYNAALSAEDMAYQRYLQEYGQWDADRQFAYNQALAAVEQANNDRSFGFNEYQAALDQYNADRNYKYTLGRDKVSDSHWKKEYDLNKKQVEAALAAKAASAGSGKKSSGGSGKKKKSSAGSSATTEKSEKQNKYKLTDITGEIEKAYKSGGVNAATKVVKDAQAGGLIDSSVSGQYIAYISSLVKMSKMK